MSECYFGHFSSRDIYKCRMVDIECLKSPSDNQRVIGSSPTAAANSKLNRELLCNIDVYLTP